MGRASHEENVGQSVNTCVWKHLSACSTDRQHRWVLFFYFFQMDFYMQGITFIHSVCVCVCVFVCVSNIADFIMDLHLWGDWNVRVHVCRGCDAVSLVEWFPKFWRTIMLQESFKMSGTTNPRAQGLIQEDQNPQKHCCENLKSHTVMSV